MLLTTIKVIWRNHLLFIDLKSGIKNIDCRQTRTSVVIRILSIVIRLRK